MLQDFDVTKKTLNVTFKKMLQKKYSVLQPKKCYKKIKHVTQKNIFDK